MSSTTACVSARIGFFLGNYPAAHVGWVERQRNPLRWSPMAGFALLNPPYKRELIQAAGTVGGGGAHRKGRGAGAVERYLARRFRLGGGNLTRHALQTEVAVRVRVGA